MFDTNNSEVFNYNPNKCRELYLYFDALGRISKIVKMGRDINI